MSETVRIPIYSVCILMVLFCSFRSNASPAVLIEENGVEIESLSAGRSSTDEFRKSDPLSSTYDLRDKKRMGIGTQWAGVGGLLSAFAELNVNPSNAVILGFGGGPEYNSFFVNWKYLMSDSATSPFFGSGYAHWYDASGESFENKKTNPRFLNSQMMTRNEIASGKFQMNFWTGSLGVQHHLLTGQYQNLSFFAGIDLLVRLESFSVAPTGNVGTTFFF